MRKTAVCTDIRSVFIKGSMMVLQTVFANFIFHEHFHDFSRTLNQISMSANIINYQRGDEVEEINRTTMDLRSNPGEPLRPGENSSYSYY